MDNAMALLALQLSPGVAAGVYFPAMRLLLFCISLGILGLCMAPQVGAETYQLRYKSDAFDDQYIGCADKMEKHMFLVLKKEKLNREFGSAWDNATEKWEEIEPTLELPDEFRDEYGIALLVYTNDYPEGNPIFRQLNNNVSAAGVSRDHYMREFHFKALHFYLTRALQLLKPDCNRTLTAYRGSDATYSLSSLFHFRQFTSSSLDKKVALRFGMGSVFRIETCFGASIRDFSFFPAEAEVLIPVTEQFRFVKQVKSLYVVESTGVQCSYFNCAYLGGEGISADWC
ncbi:ecto-ADP-ribosyltransferase 5-like [Xenopus tropicalis]|uniref:NAD(P)(+)--arginine ADP-ribosyltransferase n=1 Tax=Xenopus tropicalis TaxID=8364 RepID=A0A8J1J2P4_XENTR|nr:ecto-ADP-ribosyltransferase 5-like [Xenopus tropicalis]